MSHNSRRDRRAKASAKAVGSFVSGVARAAFEAHGFPSAAIVSEWPAIAGEEIAAFTSPERLVWPRRPAANAEQERSGPPKTGRRQTGATLVLRVSGPRAIEVQHGAPQIIERVNSYFGYRAVSNLRIIQGPVHRKAERKKSQRREPPPDEGGLERIKDDRLRHALARLNAQVD